MCSTVGTARHRFAGKIFRYDPGGVIMKELWTDRPVFGLFDVIEYGPAASTNGAVAQSVHASSSSVLEGVDTRKPDDLRPYRDGVKRFIDVALVTLTAPFWLPIVAICAAALWFEGGLPFYRQERLGRDGKRFSILKLRTMVRDADKILEELIASDSKVRDEWNSLQKLRDDPRITPVGRFLRASSLDELPQLINVLKGEMSLVGPRPMMTDQLDLYGDPTAYFAVRPGLTGLWQVSTRNNGQFTYRHGVDEAYERALTFKLDLIILFKTVGVVLRRTGC